MPNAVKQALMILLAAVAIEGAYQLVLFGQLLHNSGAGTDNLLATALMRDGIAIFIIYNIYRQQNWARILLAFNLVFVMSVVAKAHWSGKTPFLNVHHFQWLWLVEWIGRLVALVFLFLPSSRQWFTGDRKRESNQSIHPALPLLGEPQVWKYATYISIGCYVLAMTQTAYCEVTDDPARNSAGLLLIGWMGTLVSGYIEWIANPLLFYSWISALHKRYWQAVAAAVLALTLILSFLRRSELMEYFDNGSRTIAIRGYGFGYWLWLASAAIMVTVGVGLLVRQLLLQRRLAV